MGVRSRRRGRGARPELREVRRMPSDLYPGRTIIEYEMRIESDVVSGIFSYWSSHTSRSPHTYRDYSTPQHLSQAPIFPFHGYHHRSVVADFQLHTAICSGPHKVGKQCRMIDVHSVQITETIGTLDFRDPNLDEDDALYSLCHVGSVAASYCASPHPSSRERPPTCCSSIRGACLPALWRSQAERARENSGK